VLDGIHEAVVPPIAYRGALLHAQGQSVPKDEIGGDVADLVDTGRELVGWIADVSGHGARAGFLTGVVKTAVRYGLRVGRPLPVILEDMNALLPAVKETSMFVTMAALRFDGSDDAEYISAGHVPVLQYRRRQGDVVRWSMSQFPLGLFAGAAYASRRIRFEPGDIFALVTDGVVESGADQDADLGLERLEHILRGMAGSPLPEIMKAINADAGMQHDDRTVLLLRAPALECPDQARWRTMLDTLDLELSRT